MTLKELMTKILTDVNLAEFCNIHYGANFNLNLEKPKTLCIFHKENTPSFQYDRNTNTVKCWARCYSDQVGAENIEKPLNIFSVVGLKEGLECKGQDFVKILKFICEKCDIKYNFKSEKVNKKAQELLQIKTNLAMSYCKNLKNDLEKKNPHMIHSYLRDTRGLKAQTIADFYLGLTGENEAKYGKVYMSNRLSIPIFNDEGNGVIAISARQLIGSDSGLKYVHDECDEIWQRGNVLYGYSHAKKHIKALNHCYVVEGYFDMISLYQAGIKNVVAIMSNIITEAQLDKIRALTNNVTFILDQDEAGEKGFKSTIETVIKKGINAKVIPSLKFRGKDANDLCISLNWDELKIKSFLTSCSKDAIQYILSDVFDTFDSQMMIIRDHTLRVSNAMLDLINDPIKKQNYEYYIKTRLGL